MNWYVYANNNPLNQIDSTGLMARSIQQVDNPNGTVTLTWADKNSKLTDTKIYSTEIKTNEVANKKQNEIAKADYGNKGLDWIIGKFVGKVEKTGLLKTLGIEIKTNPTGDKDKFGQYLNIDIGSKVIETVRTYDEKSKTFAEREVTVFDKDGNKTYHNCSIDYKITD